MTGVQTCAFDLLSLSLSLSGPVTHSVANTLKRVVIIVASCIVFKSPMSLLGNYHTQPTLFNFVLVHSALLCPCHIISCFLCADMFSSVTLSITHALSLSLSHTHSRSLSLSPSLSLSLSLRWHWIWHCRPRHSVVLPRQETVRQERFFRPLNYPYLRTERTDRALSKSSSPNNNNKIIIQ